MADEEKTEEPTGKRIDEARKKGNIAKSQDLVQGVTLLVGVLALSVTGGSVGKGMMDVMVEAFRAIPTWRPVLDDLHPYLVPGGIHILRLVLPISLSVLLAAMLVGGLVSQGLFSMEALSPDFGKLFNPASLAKFFSGKTWMELFKNSIKMGMIAVLGVATIWPQRGSFLEMAAWPIAQQVLFTWDLALTILWRTALLLLVLGVADYFWQRYTWHEQMKMSKQEVKDEARQSEGDPQVKGKIRQLRRAMHQRFMMAEVPKATVVVTNPTHFAVALRYRQGVDRAPQVVAKGADLIAARIRQLATDAGVPIVENPPLARALHAQVEPGDEIPGDLYAAVAELLAFVMGMGGGRKVAMAARILPLVLVLGAGGMLLGSCSIFDEPAAKGPEATISLSDGSGQYRGGDVVARAHLSLCGGDPRRISWRTGHALVLSRGQTYDQDGNLTMDSVVLRWDSLPGVKDTVARSVSDTVVVHLDGSPLSTAVVPIRNILPRLDSVQAGRALDSSSLRTVPQRGDTILVAIHPGEFAYLKWRTTDPDANYPVRLAMGLPLTFPGGGSLGWRNGDPGDSVLVWRSPSTLFDTTVQCTLTDGLGQGRRRWLMRLSTYEERGSVWVGMRSQMAKFGISVGGGLVEVARLEGLRDVAGMDIDPGREGGILLLADQGDRLVRKFTSEGLVRTSSASVRRPRAVACDADAGTCWVGDEDSAGGGVLRNNDGATVLASGLPASVTAVAAEQQGTRRAWFASLDSGFLGRTTAGRMDSVLRGFLGRVKGISWDESLQWLWVLDESSGSLIAFDSSFSERQRITGLSKPTSLSAGGGWIWVSEAGAGRVRAFRSNGSAAATITGLSGPQAVAILLHQPDRAWIADTENGRLLLVSSTGVLAGTAGQGMGRPNLLAVHRGVP